jgi:hypothetical protein
VTTWRDCRRPDAAFADSSVQCLLADAQQPRRFSRADEIRALGFTYGASGVLVKEAAMATRSDDGRLEESPGDGTKNRRSAYAKSGC